MHSRVVESQDIPLRAFATSLVASKAFPRLARIAKRAFERRSGNPLVSSVSSTSGLGSRPLVGGGEAKRDKNGEPKRRKKKILAQTHVHTEEKKRNTSRRCTKVEWKGEKEETRDKTGRRRRGWCRGWTTGRLGACARVARGRETEYPLLRPPSSVRLSALSLSYLFRWERLPRPSLLLSPLPTSRALSFSRCLILFFLFLCLLRWMLLLLLLLSSQFLPSTVVLLFVLPPPSFFPILRFSFCFWSCRSLSADGCCAPTSDSAVYACPETDILLRVLPDRRSWGNFIRFEKEFYSIQDSLYLYGHFHSCAALIYTLNPW